MPDIDFGRDELVGLIIGHQVELDRLRAENAKLKAALETARAGNRTATGRARNNRRDGSIGT